MLKIRLLLSVIVVLFTFSCWGNVFVPFQFFQKSKSGEVKSGQGLYQALKDVSIENTTALQLINLLSDEVEFSKLKVGDKLEAVFDENDELIQFSFSQNPAEKHIANFNKIARSWEYSFQEEKTFWHARTLEGQLAAGSTLQQDLLAQGLSPAVVNEVVNVLLCKVNFRLYARMGDRFKVMINERKYQDQLIQTKVLYTSYDGERAGFHEAFFYEDEEKSSTYTAHYTQEGEALINAGLRYPLTQLHVRSNYGWRKHPVTGNRSMHTGVDLRGRRGQPVHAVAGGKVVVSTFEEYAGNKIGIKHSDGSTSFYLHLDKRQVKIGQFVKPNQVIGTVGATGRVTGPHLHFGFKKPNGQWMNPLNKRMIATPKLEGERLEKLQTQIANIKGLMIDLEISKVAKYIVANIPNLGNAFEFEIF
jgi:murein DD-endopeptidase MepM/ murein hydrolase activator NlpD